MTVMGNLSRLNFLTQINAGPLFAVAMRRRANYLLSSRHST